MVRAIDALDKGMSICYPWRPFVDDLDGPGVGSYG
jgi:hypothetical protein